MAVGVVALLLGLVCAGIMGLAIQRGGTCTVAAVEELLTTRRPARLVAMVEASVWVGGGLLLARELGILGGLPTGFALTHWTLAGAVLLGLGAMLNGACVIGSIARLGSGDLAFAAMPAGYYLACAAGASLAVTPAPQSLGGTSPAFGAPGVMLAIFAAMAVLRVASGLRASPLSLRRGWTPHAATAVIGLAFLGLLLLMGAWSYTDLLADLARAMGQGGMAPNLIARVLIGIALLAGALAGGALTGQWRRQAVAGVALMRCFCGGLLMGWGSLLTPGGNDSLVLIGMPLLWPYAWAAFAVMCATVAMARWSSSILVRRLRPVRT